MIDRQPRNRGSATSARSSVPRSAPSHADTVSSSSQDRSAGGRIFAGAPRRRAHRPTETARMAMNWQQELLEQTIAAAQPEQRAKKVSVPITRITTNPTADRVERALFSSSKSPVYAPRASRQRATCRRRWSRGFGCPSQIRSIADADRSRRPFTEQEGEGGVDPKGGDSQRWPQRGALQNFRLPAQDAAR